MQLLRECHNTPTFLPSKQQLLVVSRLYLHRLAPLCVSVFFPQHRKASRADVAFLRHRFTRRLLPKPANVHVSWIATLDAFLHSSDPIIIMTMCSPISSRFDAVSRFTLSRFASAPLLADSRISRSGYA